MFFNCFWICFFDFVFLILDMNVVKWLIISNIMIGYMENCIEVNFGMEWNEMNIDIYFF